MVETRTEDTARAALWVSEVIRAHEAAIDQAEGT